MLRVPANQLPRLGDVEGVMIVGDVNHPWPDEGSLAEHLRLDPGARLSERLGYLPCFPSGAVDQSADLGLQLAITHHLGLAEKERKFRRQSIASLNQPRHSNNEVRQMEGGLSRAQVAGI